MEPAAPPGGEAGEEPGFLFTWPVTGTLLLACVALARPLQLNVPHQVSTKGGAPCFLNVQKHYNIIPFDVKVYPAVQIGVGEVEPRDEAHQGAVFCDVRILLRPILSSITSAPGTSCTADFQPGPQLVQHAALRPARAHVLDHNDAEEQRHEQDDQEPLVAAAGFLIHLPGRNSNTSLRQSGALPRPGNLGGRCVYMAAKQAKTITMQQLAS